jgi:hypothetical protein
MSHFLPAPSLLRTALFAAALAAPLLACSQPQETAVTGSSLPPGTSASAAGDVVGGGGALDRTYREIYTPGNPCWSNEAGPCE